MLLEISTITVRAGHEEAFAETMERQAMPILRKVPGLISTKYGRGVEHPEKFAILAEWESMAAHAAFRELPIYPEFGQLFLPHTLGAAMEHFEMA